MSINVYIPLRSYPTLGITSLISLIQFPARNFVIVNSYFLFRAYIKQITADLSPCDPLSVIHSIYFVLFVINNSSLACMEPTSLSCYSLIHTFDSRIFRLIILCIILYILYINIYQHTIRFAPQLYSQKKVGKSEFFNIFNIFK